MEKRRFLQSFSIFDLILIAMVSAITVAFKSVAGVLIRMITGPLGIPGGALIGGFYMMWLPLVLALINKRGAAVLVSVIQIIVLLITAAPGSHGAWMALTYLLPALAAEVCYTLGTRKGANAAAFVIASIAANVTGTMGSNILFFRLFSFLPLSLMLISAAFSGAIGGALGYSIYISVKKSGILEKFNLDKSSGKEQPQTEVPEYEKEDERK